MSNAPLAYPNHVQVLRDLAEIEAFSRDPALINGKINLALHQATLTPAIETAVALLTQKTVSIIDGRKGVSPQLAIITDFPLGVLKGTDDTKLAKKWMVDAAFQGAECDETKLMPLARDIVARVKNFALTWQPEEDSENSGGRRSFFSPVHNIRADLIVQKEPYEFAEPPYYLNYKEDKNTPVVYGNVHYAGEGMIWFGNDNIQRAPIDMNVPQRANVINLSKRFSLNPGQAAFFIGNRDNGPAIYEFVPVHDERPSVSLRLARHTSQPS